MTKSNWDNVSTDPIGDIKKAVNNLHKVTDALKKVEQFRSGCGMEDYFKCSVNTATCVIKSCIGCPNHVAVVRCTTSNKIIKDGDYIIDYANGARNVISEQLYNINYLGLTYKPLEV